MKNSFILQGKKYISASRASEISGYTPDYIGQLCRADKLECSMIGRSWFVTEESLQLHKIGVLKNKIYRNRLANLQGKKKSEKTNVDLGDSLDSVHSGTTSVPSEVDHVIPSNVLNEADLASTFNNTSDEKPLYPPSTSEIRPNIFRKALAGTMLVVVVIGFITAGSFVIINTSDLSESKSMTASLSTVMKPIVGLFKNGYEGILTFFGKGKNNSDLAVNVPPASPEYPKESPAQGLAVVPSSGSETADQIMKEKIRANFSDVVQVKPDQSGTAGVVTPVFRKTKGSDFVYVLVPVSEKSPP